MKALGENGLIIKMWSGLASGMRAIKQNACNVAMTEEGGVHNCFTECCRATAGKKTVQLSGNYEPICILTAHLPKSFKSSL